MKRSEMEFIIEDIIDHGMSLGIHFAQIAENILHIQMKNGMSPPPVYMVDYEGDKLLVKKWELEHEKK